MSVRHQMALLCLAPLVFLGCSEEPAPLISGGGANIPSQAIQSEAPGEPVKPPSGETVVREQLQKNGASVVDIHQDGTAKVVVFDRYRATSLNGVAELKNVERVDVSYSKINDLAPLAEMKNLKAVVLDSSAVVHLTPLAGISQLEEISFRSTEVSDVSPLLGLAQLKRINASGTKVPEEQIEKLKQALPDCKVYD